MTDKHSHAESDIVIWIKIEKLYVENPLSTESPKGAQEVVYSPNILSPASSPTWASLSRVGLPPFPGAQPEAAPPPPPPPQA